MRKTIHSFAILWCLALPLALSAHRHNSGEDEKQKAKADRELAAKIKTSLAHDEALPADARNVTVEVQSGVVTLKGTVQSDEESQAVEATAEGLAINTLPVDAYGDITDYPMIHNEITLSSN